MKKRIITFLLATTMVFSLVGCGTGEQEEVNEQVSEVETESVVESAEEAAIENVEQSEETTEQAEETETVEKLEGFQYQITFDVDGTQKVIGFNTPDGYELGIKGGQYYNFINVDNDSFSVSAFVPGEFNEEAINAYKNYLETGEWKGLYSSIIEERFLNERKVEVPGGTATIITGVQSEISKHQSVFVDFGGCIVEISMSQPSDTIDYLSGEFVSGTEEEYIIDDILTQLFTETENTEYLYPISESIVEIAEDTYEYDLSYFDTEIEKVVSFLGFNLPEGDFAQSEDDLAFAEEYSQYGNTYYEFTDSIGNMLTIAETFERGSSYESVGVYRHFLRTGEMTEGVESVFFGEGGWMDMHTGTLVDMQLGETIETTYGTVNIVKGLWQYDILTEVTETVIFRINDREVFITLHNKNADPGVALDSHEGQLAGMLTEMF